MPVFVLSSADGSHEALMTQLLTDYPTDFGVAATPVDIGLVGASKYCVLLSLPVAEAEALSKVLKAKYLLVAPDGAEDVRGGAFHHVVAEYVTLRAALATYCSLSLSPPLAKRKLSQLGDAADGLHVAYLTLNLSSLDLANVGAVRAYPHLQTLKLSNNCLK